jgi:hypothetical protein
MSRVYLGKVPGCAITFYVLSGSKRSLQAHYLLEFVVFWVNLELGPLSFGKLARRSDLVEIKRGLASTVSIDGFVRGLGARIGLGPVATVEEVALGSSFAAASAARIVVAVAETEACLSRVVVGKLPRLEPGPRLELIIAPVLTSGLELVPRLVPLPSVAVIASRLLGSLAQID